MRSLSFGAAGCVSDKGAARTLPAVMSCVSGFQWWCVRRPARNCCIYDALHLQHDKTHGGVSIGVKIRFILSFFLSL